MTDETVTDLEEVETETEPEVTPDAEENTEASEDDSDQTEDPTEAEAEVETEEIEVDGQTYRVPTALKSSFMKSADYTQKTQQVAQTRQDLEAREAALTEQAQAKEEDLTERGQLSLIDTRLEQLRQVNWQTLQLQDPEQFGQLNAEFTQLRDASEQLSKRIETRQAETAQKSQQNYAKQLEEADAVLSRDIEGWGTELGTKLAGFARDQGVTDQQLRQVATNPGLVKLLHKAFVGDEILKQQRAAAKPKKADVVPVPKVKSGRSVSTRPSDRDSDEEWLRKRNQQIAKQRTG